MSASAAKRSSSKPSSWRRCGPPPATRATSTPCILPIGRWPRLRSRTPSRRGGGLTMSAGPCGSMASSGSSMPGGAVENDSGDLVSPGGRNGPGHHGARTRPPAARTGQPPERDAPERGRRRDLRARPGGTDEVRQPRRGGFDRLHGRGDAAAAARAGPPHPRGRDRLSARGCPCTDELEYGAPRTLSDEVFRRNDGASFPVEYTSTPISEGGTRSGALVVFRDITERAGSSASSSDSTWRSPNRPAAIRLPGSETGCAWRRIS